MELKPIKRALRPHYAAALAAAASALLMTGCQSGVGVEGTAPNPNYHPETDIVELAGEETICTDETDIGLEGVIDAGTDNSMVILDGEAPPDSVTTFTEPALEGLLPVTKDLNSVILQQQGTNSSLIPGTDEPVRLEGDVAIPGTDEPVRLEGAVAAVPSFEEVNEGACAQATTLFNAMTAGFSRAGITLTEEKETLTAFGGVPFYYPYSGTEQKIAVVFYDSKAVNTEGVCLGDFLSDYYTADSKKPWGICSAEYYKNGLYCCAFIDLSGSTQLNEDGFAQIANDILSMEN